MFPFVVLAAAQASFGYVAPLECPSEAEARGRFGVRPFSVNVVVRREAELFEGSVSFVRSDSSPVTRVIRSAGCKEVVEALALVVAIESDDAARPTARESASSVVAPPAALPAARSAASPADHRDGGRSAAHEQGTTAAPPAFFLGLDAGGGVALGMQPGVGTEVSAAVTLGLARFGRSANGPRLRLGGAASMPTSAESRGLSADFRTYRGRLDLCPFAFGGDVLRVLPCLRQELGALAAEDVNFIGGRTSTDLFATTGISALVQIHPTGGRWFIQTELAGTVAWAPRRYQVDTPSTELFAASRLAGATGISVGFTTK